MSGPAPFLFSLTNLTLTIMPAVSFVPQMSTYKVDNQDFRAYLEHSLRDPFTINLSGCSLLEVIRACMRAKSRQHPNYPKSLGSLIYNLTLLEEQYRISIQPIQVTDVFWGYFISFPIMAGLTYFGYLLMKNVDNKNLWIILLVALVAFAFALTAGVTLFKVIFHRPRFRAIESSMIPYYPWYERCSDYKGYMETFGLASEEFKSFPSGHAAASMGVPLIALFLPLIDEKYRKYRLPVFICGLVFSLLVMFSRLLVGAHYLSDVSMGAIIATLCMIVAIEVIRSLKKFNL